MPTPHVIAGARTPDVQRWFETRTYRAETMPRPPAERRERVAVVIPARNEARTIGAICTVIAERLIPSLVDDLVVVDCDSTDRTAQIAAAAGATVVSARRVLPEVPWQLGKGEAMWRGLATVDADIVCFVDGDIKNFDERFVERLVTPLLADSTLAFTKGFYRRPLKTGTVTAPADGGRVTELTARPLLNLLYPELAGFLQPLAGEYAARTSAISAIPFLTGYGVDVAMLIDLLGTVGLEAMAQVDLDERVHRNRPLRELRAMATVVAEAVIRRAERDRRLSLETETDRPLLFPGPGTSLEMTLLPQEERPPINRVLGNSPKAAMRGRR